ncbi:hypothetical protein BGZ83_000545, partial [Gryganskiella cystojenkinii]
PTTTSRTMNNNNQLSAVDSVTGARERIGDLLRDSPNRVSYQILDILGYGTYGCIYLARTLSSPSLSPEYKAIKCLSKKGLNAAQLILQRQEIDLHLSLSSVRQGQHPNIVDMSSVIETKDSLFLVMEYCSGGDLYDTITSQHAAGRDSGVDFVQSTSRSLNVHSDSSVIEAMSQIISALAHSHSRQVFHRDLKPENILVAGDGSLKLADFGLATKERVSTDFGCGSSFYMAPEQQPRATVGRRPYSPSKSDVWSLGIIFLNLRFGRNPWKLSRVDMDATFAAYAQNPDVLKEMFPELSASAMFFLQRVLCVDPSDRADCFEALELIQRVDKIVCEDVKFSNSRSDCDDDRVDSEMSVDDSSVTSSRSSGQDSLSHRSIEEDTQEETEDDDEQQEEESSMFRMENDYGARNQPRSRRSCSSSWSMSSSGQSMKSWSDMIEEDEMDFSLPVEFGEAVASDAATAATAAIVATISDNDVSLTVCESDDDENDDDDDEEEEEEDVSTMTASVVRTSEDSQCSIPGVEDHRCLTTTITTTSTLNKPNPTRNNNVKDDRYFFRPSTTTTTTTSNPHFDDPDDDCNNSLYHQPFKRYDHLYHHSNYNKNNKVLNNSNSLCKINAPAPLPVPMSALTSPPSPCWSPSLLAWGTDEDTSFDFTQAGFAKLSELMFSSSTSTAASSRANSRQNSRPCSPSLYHRNGMFSFGQRDRV